ncbi:hypothetical protein [Vibrio parahaemolyticus]|uniref:hypothetical protein n=1 Tax=Vibrio parahaemolyticus TaxID=670 RepID=UPI0023EB850B|nr:hypothetical protein [Vibrio parahaemolyticus]
MFVVLYCHNQERTDFSFTITETFLQDDGSSERGTFDNADAFRHYVNEQMGSVEHHTIDLIEEGLDSLQYTQEALKEIAASMTQPKTYPAPLVEKTRL